MNPSKKTGWAQRQEPGGSGSSWDVDVWVGWVGWSGWVGWVGWGQFRPKKWPARFCRDLFASRVLLGIHVVLLTACRLGRGVPENTFIQSGREKVFAQNPCPTSYFLFPPDPHPQINKNTPLLCLLRIHVLLLTSCPARPPTPNKYINVSLSTPHSLLLFVRVLFIQKRSTNKDKE